MPDQCGNAAPGFAATNRLQPGLALAALPPQHQRSNPRSVPRTTYGPSSAVLRRAAAPKRTAAAVAFDTTFGRMNGGSSTMRNRDGSRMA